MDASLIAPTPSEVRAVVMRLFKSAALFAKPLSPIGLLNSSVNLALRFDSSMRSCGRLGPATDGLIVVRSSVTTFV